MTMAAYEPGSAGLPSFNDFVSMYASAANARTQSRELSANIDLQYKKFAEDQEAQDMAIAATKQKMSLEASQELRNQMFAQQALVGGAQKLAENELNLDAMKRAVVSELQVVDLAKNGATSGVGSQPVVPRNAKKEETAGKVPTTAPQANASVAKQGEDLSHPTGPLESVAKANSTVNSIRSSRGEVRLDGSALDTSGSMGLSMGGEEAPVAKTWQNMTQAEKAEAVKISNANAKKWNEEQMYGSSFKSTGK